MNPLDILTAPWSIVPEKYREIAEIYQTHLKGDKIDLEVFKSATKQGVKKDEEMMYDVVNGVAIIDIQGILSKKRSFFGWLFGGSSTLYIAEVFKTALQDPNVKSILLNIDSPGGSVAGTADLAQLIYESREQKPVTAFTDNMMASAAYWIGSAADQIFISNDTTQVGSIGVIATLVDYTEMYKKEGIKIAQIVAGKYKNVGSPYKPLTDEDKKVVQNEVDYFYSVFVNTVAKHRDVSVDHVLKVMATDTPPPVFIGEQAIRAGLVDGVSTMDGLLNKLADGDSAAGLSFKKASKNKIETEEVEHMFTLKELKDKHPEIYQAVVDEILGSEAVKEKCTSSFEEGKKSGLAEGKEQGLTEGAEAERKRIQDVEAQLMPGHEKLILEMKFDGKTTGAEAAVKVLAAEKAMKEAKVKAFNDDGKDVTVQHDHADADADADANLPVEERTKKIWDSKPEIRAEFKNYDSYLAYIKAVEAGKVKVLGKK